MSVEFQAYDGVAHTLEEGDLLLKNGVIIQDIGAGIGVGLERGAVREDGFVIALQRVPNARGTTGEVAVVV
jgi:precorrin-6B methylase 2